jgi:hypothetical protein
MSTKSVKSFLGLANFYKKFKKDFSTFEPNHSPTFWKKKRSFEWKGQTTKNVWLPENEIVINIDTVIFEFW